MQENSFEKIPQGFVKKWQEIADLIANIINVPAALIMKTENEFMEVFTSSKTKNNPYKVGDKEHWYGLYCETVIKTQKKLHIPNALKDKNWDKNPDIKPGMIAYLGFPINFPDKTPFGTLCVLDKKERQFSVENEKLLLQFKKVIELDLTLIFSLGLNKNYSHARIIQKLSRTNEEFQARNEELKQVEEVLKKEKVWSENIVNYAPNIIVGLGEKSRIKVFNHYAERLTGYKAEEVIGKEWINMFIPEELKETIYRVWDDIVKNKQIDHNFENEIKTKYGEKRMIEWHNTILTENEEFRMILSIGTDITDRKQAEKEAKRYNNLFENSLNEIYIFNSENLQFLQANEAAQNNLGYTQSELQQLTPLDIKPEFTKEQFKKLISTLHKGSKEKLVFETIHQRKDKSTYDVEVHLELMYFDDKKVFVAFINDITKRTQAEKEIMKLNEQLEQKVAEKTKELEERISELERFHDATIQREFRIKELRDEIEQLKKEKE